MGRRGNRLVHFPRGVRDWNGILNDREYNAQKKRIRSLTQKWIRPLGLGQWRIDIDYCRENEIALSNGHDPESAFSALMDVQTQWEYMQASIRINMPFAAGLDDETLERAFVHELMHVMVCEMRVPDWAGAPIEVMQSQRDHEERVVTTLANAMLWIRQAGHDEGAKVKQQPETKEQAE